MVTFRILCKQKYANKTEKLATTYDLNKIAHFKLNNLCLRKCIPDYSKKEINLNVQFVVHCTLAVLCRCVVKI